MVYEEAGSSSGSRVHTEGWSMDGCWYMKGVRTEHQEQALLVARVRLVYPSVLLAAVPNGGYRHKRVAAALKAEGVLPGMPDLLLIERRGGYVGMAIEMKRVGGRASKAQLDVLNQLRARGWWVLLARDGADEAWGEVELYLAGKIRLPVLG